MNRPVRAVNRYHITLVRNEKYQNDKRQPELKSMYKNMNAWWNFKR